MAKNTASEETLGLIHARMAERYLALLQGTEPLTAAQEANILKFLSNNNIVASSDTDTAIDTLRATLRAGELAMENQRALATLPTDDEMFLDS